jgi:hypothetical protein
VTLVKEMEGAQGSLDDLDRKIDESVSTMK